MEDARHRQHGHRHPEMARQREHPHRDGIEEARPHHPGPDSRAIRGIMSVFAFASIVMTYFGVNFHLSGLHSYASGEKQNVTYYIYIAIVVAIISALAYFPYKKYYKK